MRIPSKRPKSKEIVEMKQLWALNEDEFEFEHEISSILDLKKNDKIYVYSIIRSKLDHYLKKKSVKRIRCKNENNVFLKTEIKAILAQEIIVIFLGVIHTLLKEAFS
jgi:hypothetical protein